MSIPAHCENCGYSWQSDAIRVVGDIKVKITASRTSCPRCGAIAQLEDGLYNAVGKVVEAAFAPGVTRDSVIAFQAVTEAAKAGSITAAEVELRSERISQSFGTLWRWLNENGVALTTVMAILTVLISLYAARSADESSDQQRTGSLH